MKFFLYRWLICSAELLFVDSNFVLFKNNQIFFMEKKTVNGDVCFFIFYQFLALFVFNIDWRIFKVKLKFESEKRVILSIF